MLLQSLVHWILFWVRLTGKIMTENQEKEMFGMLSTLVTEVQEIRNTQIEHSQILNRLDAKTDSVADTVIKNDKRLTVVEKIVADLRGGIY